MKAQISLGTLGAVIGNRSIIRYSTEQPCKDLVYLVQHSSSVFLRVRRQWLSPLLALWCKKIERERERGGGRGGGSWRKELGVWYVGTMYDMKAAL